MSVAMFSFQYDIVGHSGEGFKFDMVKQDKPPKNNKDRLDVIKVNLYVYRKHRAIIRNDDITFSLYSITLTLLLYW